MTRLRTWFELIRLPNVFTALADVLAGFWLGSVALAGSWRLAALLIASAALYSAGIVFNNLHDLEVDRKERPSRPLPSGRVTAGGAWRLAVVLSLVGVAAAAIGGSRGGDLRAVLSSIVSAENRPGLVSIVLLMAILSYNFVFKNTPAAPVIMGTCRGLNLLMALTASAGEWTPDPQTIACVSLLVYVASFTWFGRDEAVTSHRLRLVLGAVGISVGLISLVVFVAWNPSGDKLTLVLWLALGFHMLRTALRAIRHPEPAFVQHAMKTFIFGIIAFDAVLAASVAGWAGALVVFALLAPALLVGKQLYST